MKWVVICLLTLLAMALPCRAHAQFDDNQNRPPPYNDVDDGQALRIASYVLAPFGYALEWGLTRPLNYAATNTPAAPVLSGDTSAQYFAQSSNADRLPPSTFAPFVVPPNPNALEADTTAPAPASHQGRRDILPPVPQYEGYRSAPSAPVGQPALH